MNSSASLSARDHSTWRDLLVASAAAVLAALVAIRFELHERIFEFTRNWESLQLDEWPIGLLAFAVMLALLLARRHAQLRRALRDNRRLTRQALVMQEEERRRLARELHDELGQYLNAIQLDTRSLGTAPADASQQEAAARIAANADHVYGVVSDLVRQLRPAALDELGLASALEACVDRWRALRQPTIDLRLQGDVDELGEELNLAVYRIVQEALTNAVRHARASRVEIELSAGATLRLAVRDDGVGLDQAGASPGGHGLSGMRERAELLGGRMTLQSAPGGGLVLEIELPRSVS